MLTPKKRYNRSTCFDIIKNNALDSMDGNESLIKDTFEDNEGFSYVYINFDLENKYKAIIYEGNFKDTQCPYKRIHCYPYEKEIFKIGQYISYYDAYNHRIDAIIDALDTHNKEGLIGHIYKCNNILNIINDGVLYSYPCYKAKSVQRPDFIYTSEVNIPDARLELTVQRNEQTMKIEENDRIILDGVPYKITHTDKHNNIDIYDRTGGLIYLICVKDSKQPDDDLENDIANKSRLLEDKESEEPKEDEISIIVSPSEFEIIQGESQTYTVKKYVNGIESNELLTITDNSTMRKGYYELTIGNNEFIVKNLKRIVSKNVEISISDILGNTKDISIKLKGAW